jgi:hypothetical protein
MTLVGPRKMALYDNINGRKLAIFAHGAAFRNGTVVVHNNGVQAPQTRQEATLRIVASEFVADSVAHITPVAEGRGVDVVAILEAAQKSIMAGGDLRYVNTNSPRLEAHRHPSVSVRHPGG